MTFFSAERVRHKSGSRGNQRFKKFIKIQDSWIPRNSAKVLYLDIHFRNLASGNTEIRSVRSPRIEVRFCTISGQIPTIYFINYWLRSCIRSLCCESIKVLQPVFVLFLAKVLFSALVLIYLKQYSGLCAINRPKYCIRSCTITGQVLIIYFALQSGQGTASGPFELVQAKVLLPVLVPTYLRQKRAAYTQKCAHKSKENGKFGH